MFCGFLCILDLDDNKHDEHAMNARFLVFHNLFDPHELWFACVSLFVAMHWTTSASTWLFDWSLFAYRATSLYETARFIK